MEQNINYYEILGITEDEKQLQGDKFTKVLKKKWKIKAVEYHPDKYANKSEAEKQEAEEKFKQISEAYEVLNDSQKRMMYDRFGTVKPQTMHTNPFQNPWGFRGFGFNPFADMQPVQVKGSDINLMLTVSLKQIYDNETVNVTYDVYVPCEKCNGKGTTNGKVEDCPHCHGTGVYVVTKSNNYMTSMQQSPCPYCNATGKKVTDPCKNCQGEGVVMKKQTLAIKLPKGCQNGTVIRLNQQGNCAPRNEGERGDLRIQINVNCNGTNFELDNSYSLFTTVKVSVLDCLTGCKKTIILPNGTTAEMNVIPGSVSNTVNVVGSYGLIQADGTRGMLIAKIEMQMPEKLSEEEKDIINKLKQTTNFKKL